MLILGASCDLLGWNRSRNFVHAIELSGRKFQPTGYQKRLQLKQLDAIIHFYQRHNPNALKAFVKRIRSSMKNWLETTTRTAYKLKSSLFSLNVIATFKIKKIKNPFFVSNFAWNDEIRKYLRSVQNNGSNNGSISSLWINGWVWGMSNRWPCIAHCLRIEYFDSALRYSLPFLHYNFSKKST